MAPDRGEVHRKRFGGDWACGVHGANYKFSIPPCTAELPEAYRLMAQTSQPQVAQALCLCGFAGRTLKITDPSAIAKSAQAECLCHSTYPRWAIAAEAIFCVAFEIGS